MTLKRTWNATRHELLSADEQDVNGEGGHRTRSWIAGPVRPCNSSKGMSPPKQKSSSSDSIEEATGRIRYAYVSHIKQAPRHELRSRAPAQP